MSKIKAIINANIVLENGIIWDGTLVIEDDIISEVGSKGKVNIPDDAEIIDANGSYVGPGFVDIHVHAAKDFQSFLEPEKFAMHFLKYGETSILATSSAIIPYEETLKGIVRVKEAMKTFKNIKGINMEGPYFNPNYGAAKTLDVWYKGQILEEEYKPLVDTLGDAVKIWTIGPEMEGVSEFIKYAREVNLNLVFAVGHSEATPEQIRKLGSKYRPKLTTHIMNATGRSTLDSRGLRGYGPDEYCFADNEMYAELISDSAGVHVHSDLQRMIVKCKGVERVVLITDSTTEKRGTPKALYMCHDNLDDVNFNEHGSLSGSKLTMNKACRNIMSHTNCGIAQAFVMASLNPARVIGMDDEIGSIEVGKMADLVFVDDRFNVKKVILNGEVCTFKEE